MDWILYISAVLLTITSTVGKEQCSEEITLGMGSTGPMYIPDSAITSSTFEPGFEASKGRYDSDVKHGAWCPGVPVDMDTYQWIQIDFSEMVTISHIQIAGEFNDGEGTRFTKKFRIEYQRTEGGPWVKYTDENGDKEIFNGNTNTHTAHFLTTNHTLLAARVRVVPLSDVREFVCMRVEFYGCVRHGIATYSAPIGDTRGERFTFSDTFYDGEVVEGRTTGGLGLLTNGSIGTDSYSSSPEAWLGWRDDSHSNVMLLFEMDHVRNISQISIQSNNQLSNQVRVFKRALIHTSIGGAFYTPDPVKVFTYTPDDAESSRPVYIPVDYLIAKFVKIVLEFEAKWIMISEVTFESQLVTGQVPLPEVTTIDIVQPTASTAQPIIPPDVTESSTTQSIRHTRPERVTPDNNPGGGDSSTVSAASGTGSDKQNKGAEINGTLIGIIVGSCVGVILVVVFIIIICCVYQRRGKPSTPSRHHFNQGDDSTISLPHTQKNHHATSSNGSDVYDLPWSRPLPHPPQPGATLQSSGYMSDASGAQYACIPIDQYNNAAVFPHQLVSRGSQPQMRVANMTCSSGSCLHHYMTAGGGLLTLPGVNHDRHACTQRMANTLPIDPHNDLLIPLNFQKTQNGVSCDPNSYDLVQPDTCGSPYDASNYQRSPAASLPNIQGSTGNSVYGAHLTPPTAHIEDELQVIPSNQIRFVEKLGAGQYGEVNLCEMSVPPLQEGADSSNSASKLVAVKKLQSNADEATKQDFIREIRIMSRLKHDNIVQVLGIITGNTAADSPCVVTEYMRRGDLHQFLQHHVPEGTSLLNKKALSQSTLLYISTQIAEGMSYLESLNVTHRDLAARNCLVEDGYRVKISDFGMSRSLYSQQYYKVEGRVVLPIRWMAWESVLLGKFTTRSDVWSYGVTLWEIYSFAREQPFSTMLDDDVIANCMNYYSNNEQEIATLYQPHQCNKEMYDLMRACWNLADYNRPTFKDISLYLQRKQLPSHNHTNGAAGDRKQSLTRLTTC